MNPVLETLRLRALEIRAQILDRFGHDLAVTDRLKMMLAGAGIVLVFSLFLALDSFVGSLETRHTRIQVDLERLKEQIETSSWQARSSNRSLRKDYGPRRHRGWPRRASRDGFETALRNTEWSHNNYKSGAFRSPLKPKRTQTNIPWLMSKE